MTVKGQQPTPFLDIQSPTFAEQYERGACWSMHGEEQGTGPLSIHFLKAALEISRQRGFFEHDDPSWRSPIGFSLGRYHGRVLCPHTGQLRPGVTALIAFDHPQATRGYAIGREAFFHEAEPHYRYSESALGDYLHALVLEAPHWTEPENDWMYALGCLLGELSGALFLETREEEQAWQEACRRWDIEQGQGASLVQQGVALQEA